MPHDPTRRHFLVSAAVGAAGFALDRMPSAMAAPPGLITVVNYATYVADRGKVNAARAGHQVYADALRESDRLVMGGPLLGDDGRPSGVLLVYAVTSMRQAETLAQDDPFVQQGAIADYRLDEWEVRDTNIALLAAALVPQDRRAPPAAADTQAARLFVSYLKRAAAPARVERANDALLMTGPFADGAGAMSIYRAPSKEEAMALAEKDAYRTGGVFEPAALSEWRLFGLNAGLIRRG